MWNQATTTSNACTSVTTLTLSTLQSTRLHHHPVSRDITPVSKLTRKKIVISDEKIRTIVSSLNGLIARMEKCRSMRGVTGLRPPPGGPIAAINCVSTRNILLVSFKSYQCRWSKNWRSSSIGGWAPYISLAGMFMSSIKIIAFLFGGGPK